MPLYSYNGQLFQVGGLLAANQACCCSQNTCCYLGVCLEGLTEEECDSLSGIFRSNEACEEDGLCECDNVDPVRCCLNNNCLAGSAYQVFDPNIADYVDAPLTECDCERIGGVPVSDCVSCPECDYEDETPFEGRICLPGGDCIDVSTTLGELCFFPFSYLLEEGLSCEDTPPCEDVLPVGDCCWTTSIVTYYYVDTSSIPPCFFSYYEAIRCPSWGDDCDNGSTFSIGPSTGYFGWEGTGVVITPRPCGCTDGYYTGVSTSNCTSPCCTNASYPKLDCTPPPECS